MLLSAIVNVDFDVIEQALVAWTWPLAKAHGVMRSNHKYFARHPRARGGYWYEYVHPVTGERMVHHRDGDHLPVHSEHRLSDIAELQFVHGKHSWSPVDAMPSMRDANWSQARARAKIYEKSDTASHSVTQIGNALARECESIEHWRRFAHTGLTTRRMTSMTDEAFARSTHLKLDIPTIRRLSGIPDTSYVHVACDSTGSLRIDGDNQIVVMRRIVYNVHHAMRSNLLIKNSYQMANESGHGFGWRNLLTQILECRRIEKSFGRTRISVDAVGGHDSNGHITWLFEGYRSSDHLHLRDFRDGLSSNIANQPIEQLPHSPDGRLWWKTHGSSFEAYFDPWDRYCISALSVEIARRTSQ